MTRYDRLQKQIQRLTLADKQALQAWLSADIEQEQQPPAVKPISSRKVAETTLIGRITYKSELIRCGKPKCCCVTKGSLHGPYRYGSRKEKGRLKSWYIGKELKLLDDDEVNEAEAT
jgi:hypothetical protein